MDIILLLQEHPPEDTFIQFEIAFVVLLTIITGVAMVVDRIGNRVPYTVALVIVGLAFTFLPERLELDITKELILSLLVPPLVFEGALHISWERLKRNLLPILLMAVIGVIVGTWIVGQILITFLDIPPAAAFAFGALISATDPVAVIAFFRTLGVSKRLATLVEGESLFNDGTAIVIFNLALVAGAAAATGTTSDPAIRLTLGDVGAFLAVSAGGLAVGFIVSMVANYAIFRPVDNRLIETTVTMVIVFGSFLIAEQIQVTESLHMSGILAVVAAGIYFGNVTPQHMRPGTRLAVNSFWEVFSFAATSIIFLLIGLGIDIREFISINNLRSVAIAVAAVLFSRALVVYSATWLSGRLGTAVPLPFRHVIFWGGLRGAISLALALGLSPTQFGEEQIGVVNQLRLMTFGVVLFTLLVQGMTTGPLLRRLGLAEKPVQDIERQRRLGRLYATRAGQQEIDRLHDTGVLSGTVWTALADAYRDEVNQRGQEVLELLHEFPGLEPEIIVQARRAALRAERTALIDALRRDLVSEQIQHELLEEIDARLSALDKIEKSLDYQGDYLPD